MEELLFEDHVAYMPGLSIGVQMATPAPQQRAVEPTTGKIDQGAQGGGSTIKIADWGDANDFPQEIAKILEGDAEMVSLIDWKVRAVYGKGPVCLQRTGRNDDGSPIYKAINDPVITDWFESDQVSKYCHEGLIDLFTYANVFPELIVSKDRNTIPYIGLNEAAFCRWQLMDDDGKLKTIVHNRNFPNAKLDDTKQTTVIPALDPYDFDLVENLRADSARKKVVYPLNYPSVTRTYYQVAHWDGLRVSGWIEIAAQIPAFKKALLKNQMTIKYLIRIPNSYWPSVYKDWDKYDEKEQKAKKKEKLEEINKSLTDVQNTGKSILNEVGIDPLTGEKIPGWEITVIDDKTKAGAFLEDSQEASAHKMRALGLDPTLVGTLLTGKGMGAGAGSDKQLAWNIFLATCELYRKIILEPLHFVARFNGIMNKYPGFTIRFRDSIMETVNGHNQNATEGLT